MSVTTPAGLAAEFYAAAEALEPRVSQVVRKTLLDIQGDAQIMAPVDTGHLESSITMEMTGTTEGQVGPEANYGRYVEEGTWKMAAQPYLTPAAERRIPPAVEALADLAGWEGRSELVVP